MINAHGAAFKAGIRPEDITISENGVPARLIAADYLGADSIVTAKIGLQELVIRLPGHVRINDGEQVNLSWPKNAVHVFDADTGIRASH